MCWQVNLESKLIAHYLILRLVRSDCVDARGRNIRGPQVENLMSSINRQKTLGIKEAEKLATDLELFSAARCLMDLSLRGPYWKGTWTWWSHWHWRQVFSIISTYFKMYQQPHILCITLKVFTYLFLINFKIITATQEFKAFTGSLDKKKNHKES